MNEWSSQKNAKAGRRSGGEAIADDASWRHRPESLKHCLGETVR